jgi:hypothetical protein
MFDEFDFWHTCEALPMTIIFWVFKYTSVVYAICPSVNTWRVQLIFPTKLNFCNLFEFLATKSIQKTISSTP